MSCPSCGHANREGARFCGECAAPLTADLTCPSCGRSNQVSQRFCDSCARPLTTESPAPPGREPRDYTPKHLADKILQSKSALEGERKQVTVLFADVKGSMELQEGIDPEEWHGIMDRFFQILTEGIHRYEGTVNQYTGDGVMALFGAPIAHEDHAQRACYAALRLNTALAEYTDELRRTKGLNLSVRLGLNSGEVVVGKIGDDLRMDYTAQGHTVGLASRIEEIAAPDRAYLSEHTAKLVEGFFQLGDLGRFNLKGVQEPLRVYELQGVGPQRTRLEVSEQRGLVRFVGRHTEMEQLRRSWQAAQAGHGQIVGVVGEAGVGKSRLLHEFKAPLERGCLVLDAFSVSHGKAYSYLPLIDLLKGYLQITPEDDERQRREKVTGKVLTLDRTLEDTLPYLFSLLGIEDERASLAQMDPKIRKRRTLEAAKRVLVRETLNQPCLLIFEDLHWIDAETQAFLDVLSDSVATARLLLLVDYRPEYRHGWGSKTCYSQLRLDPLGKEEARELLTALLGEEVFEEREALENLVLEKTEGNPFFTEELVQTLAEEGVLTGERGRYALERSPSELHIPATVQGVLAARIDRLPPQEKDLLQTLAVIGKEFPFSLIGSVTEQREEDLYRRLSHLQAGEFIYEQPAFPEPEYRFKHALTQEVAYQSLLGERRGVLHERTARAIEGLYPDVLDAHYGQLAHHYSRTKNTPKAVEYLRLAGEQALQRSAYEEAISQLTSAVELLETLPETSERAQQELPLQLTLGRALTTTRGYGTTEAERAFVRARDLAERVGDDRQRFQALQGVSSIHLLRMDLDRTAALAEEQLRLAERTGVPAQHLSAHWAAGVAALLREEFSEVRAHTEEVIGRYDPQEYRTQESLHTGSEDPWVIARSHLSVALFYLGYPDQALTGGREALALARELSHPVSEAWALSFLGVLQRNRGEAEAALQAAETLIALANEHGLVQLAGMGAYLRAAAMADQGQTREAASLLAILDAQQTTGSGVVSAPLLLSLAEAQGKAGEVAKGLESTAHAQAIMTRTGGTGVLPKLSIHVVKGELLMARSPSDHAEAEACFLKALDVARHQSARSPELRAATSLARLWQWQGRTDEARALLAPVYDWFTEGFDTRDLRDAKALLDELG